MISAVFFVNLKGDLIIHRFYRDNVSRSAVEAFRSRVVAAKKTGQTPIVDLDKTHFCYSRAGDVYVVAVTRHNANPSLVFQFLYKMVEVFRAYFGGNFDEENIRNNFVLIYELLDEMMDYGYPQITAVNVLSTFIKSIDSHPTKEMEEKENKGLTEKITGAVDWRQAGRYRYRKNEIFIDVLESVNLLWSSKTDAGGVLRSDVSGKIIMKTYLSGMPECKFGMNDKLVMDKESKQAGAGERNRPPTGGIAIDDVTFHRCVRLGQFDQDRTISFIPPDGEFELMKYRITQNVNLPFRVLPVITEHGKTRVEYEVKIKGQFSSKLFATGVVVKIPTPKNTAKCKIVQGLGKAKYFPDQSAILWKIKKFPGDASFILKAEVSVAASVQDKSWARPPITMEFQVPMFTSSGLHVRFLKVFEHSGYQTIKWVRYITRAGQYQIRI